MRPRPSTPPTQTRSAHVTRPDAAPVDSVAQREADVLHLLNGPSGLLSIARQMEPGRFEPICFDGAANGRYLVLKVNGAPKDLEGLRIALERAVGAVAYPVVVRRSESYLQARIDGAEAELKQWAPSYFTARPMPDGSIDVRFDPTQPLPDNKMLGRIRERLRDDAEPRLEVNVHH